MGVKTGRPERSLRVRQEAQERARRERKQKVLEQEQRIMDQEWKDDMDELRHIFALEADEEY